MRDPRKILTQRGYFEYLTQLMNLENALFYLRNNADDLHIGSTEETSYFQELCDSLESELELNRQILENGLPGYEEDEDELPADVAADDPEFQDVHRDIMRSQKG